MDEKRNAEKPAYSGPYQPRSDKARVIAAEDPNNHHLPESYEDCVEEWLTRKSWSVEETAHLLTGFRADRPLGLGTPEHEDWDVRVLFAMDVIKQHLGRDLPAVDVALGQWPPMYPKAAVYSPAVLDWARERMDMSLPEPLDRLGSTVRVIRVGGGTAEVGGLRITGGERTDGRCPPITLSELQALVRHSTKGIRMLLWAIRHIREVNPPGEGDTQEVIAKYIEKFAPEKISGRMASAIKDLISTPDQKAGGPKSYEQNSVRRFHYRNLISDE